MQVTVTDHYTDSTHHFSGLPDDVKDQIFKAYPFLLEKVGPHANLELVLRILNSSQVASVGEGLAKTEGQGLHAIQMHREGEKDNTKNLAALCEAASFLTGTQVDPIKVRMAMMDENNPMDAVLMASGLDPVAGKEAILGVLSVLKKSVDDEEIRFKEIVATTPSGGKMAEFIKEANDKGNILPLKLNGVHSEGTLKATLDGVGYILKPGAGPQNPALGESESASSQSRREAAFYDVATAWGLGKYLPECRLLLLDGKEYACMYMLPYNYKDFNELKEVDPGMPRRVLFMYLTDVFKWATLDYVLGNPDRNAGNIMASGSNIKLIDHGSAFAGTDFDPPRDRCSFLPYYLKAFAPSDYQSKTVDERLACLPRLSTGVEYAFKKWLMDLSGDILTNLLGVFGIESLPSKNRLQRLQEACGYQRADLAVLSAWVV